MRVAILAAVLALAAGVAGWAAAAAQTVRVTLTGTSVRVSAKTLQPGAVRFVVTNDGRTPARFVVAGHKTRVLAPHRQTTLTVTLAKPGSYAYGLVGRASAGKLVIAGPTTYALTPVGTFDTPDFVTSPPGDAHRLFVVQQGGLIHEVIDGKTVAQPFLDLRSAVDFEDEDGLLSMVFAPDYATSHKFYVYYNDRDGNVRLVEYQTRADDQDVVDLSTRRQVLFINKPYANHNGSMMQFGSDGYLYVSVGDGDAGVKNKPGAFAQTMNDLLGNILRIDPEHGDPYTVPSDNPFVGVAGDKPEIWDYGFRNPWRFWIDQPTGDIYIGDVQLGGPEEVDYVAGNAGGKNFGWPCFQGTVPFDQTATCPDAVPPIVEYPHENNQCAVIGGVTVHDPSLPALAGYYVYGDLCTGEIRAFHVVNGKAVNLHPLHLSLPGLDSFGVDGAGHVYAVSTNGSVDRLTVFSASS